MDIVHHIFFVGLTVAKLSIVLVYPLSNDIRMPGNAGSTRLFFLVAEKKSCRCFLEDTKLLFSIIEEELFGY